MLLSLQKNDSFSIYYRKKILDYLFYGKSLKNSIFYLKKTQNLNVFSFSLLNSLELYIHVEPILPFVRRQILDYLDLFRTYCKNQNSLEHSKVIQKINQIITELNIIPDTSLEIFFDQQKKSRFTTPIMKFISHFILINDANLDNFMNSITFDLDLLYICSENLNDSDFSIYCFYLLLNEFSLDAINAIQSECPNCFKDPIFLKRIYYLLEQNYFLLHKKIFIEDVITFEVTSTYEETEEMNHLIFQIRNQELKRKLTHFQKKFL